MAPSIRLGEELGVGRYGTVLEAKIGDTEYAIKKFDEDAAFCNEQRAYNAISELPSLHGRICRSEGPVDDTDLMPALLLQRLYGPALCDVILDLPRSKREKLREYLHHTLTLLHSELELAHGDIKADNIIVEGEIPVIIDFTHATFKSDVDDKDWFRETRVDHDFVDNMFIGAEAEKATVELSQILADLGPDVPERDVQHVLASLLNCIPTDWPLPQDPRHIQQVVPNPIPALALPLARHLSSLSHEQDALNLLMEAINHEERHPTPDLSDVPRTLCLMRHEAASCADQLDRWRIEVTGPDVFQLYQDALSAFSLLYDASEPAFLRLRLDYARYLQYAATPEDTIRECGVIFKSLAKREEHMLTLHGMQSLLSGIFLKLRDGETASRAEALFSDAEALSQGRLETTGISRHGAIWGE